MGDTLWVLRAIEELLSDQPPDQLHVSTGMVLHRLGLEGGPATDEVALCMSELWENGYVRGPRPLTGDHKVQDVTVTAITDQGSQLLHPADRVEHAYVVYGTMKAMSLDDRVLQFVADWDEALTGHGELYAHDIASEIHENVGKVARTLDRLAKAGKIEALDATSMGSVYPEYMVTGISSFGRNEVDRMRAGFQPYTQPAAPGGGHVTINVHGVVGTLNTGQVIGNIETNVRAAIGDSAGEFAEAVAKLVEAIAADSMLTDERKKEAIESIEALSEQSKLPEGERKMGPIKALIAGIPTTLGVAVEARTAWDAWGPALLKFFGT